MKARSKRLIVAMMVTVLIVLTVGAAGALSIKDLRNRYVEAHDGKKIVFITAAMVYELARAWEYAIRTESKKLGMKYELVDANMNPDLLIQGLKSQIKKKPDLLVVHNLSMQQLSRDIKKAEEVGIPVIQVSLQSNYVSRAFAGPDWEALGRSMAEEIAKDIGKNSGKSGKVAIIAGSMSAADTVIFNMMAKEVFAKHPEIKIVLSQGTGWDADKYRELTATVLQQHPDLAAIWGHYGIHTIAAGQAVKEAGLQDKVMVYTTGTASYPIRDAIEAGLIDKFWAYNSLQQGHDIMNAARMILQDNCNSVQNKFALYTDISLITKDNYKERGDVFYAVPKK